MASKLLKKKLPPWENLLANNTIRTVIVMNPTTPVDIKTSDSVFRNEFHLMSYLTLTLSFSALKIPNYIY